ncbi:MAG: hypothetical protein AAGD38_22915 [Acidobacteriota bacterium]
MNRSIFLGSLAEMALGIGMLEDSADMLAEAHAVSEPGGERFWKAELHRLSGELACARGSKEAARAAFHDALTVAREQGALSLELRAATSLFELDRDAESNALLAEVYGRFTEGFDTPDLTHAANLLALPTE